MPPAPAVLSSAEARPLLLSGRVAGPLRVSEALDLSNEPGLRRLPEHLTCTRLDVSGCTNLTHVPGQLTCDELVARDLPLRTLPATLRVRYRLVLDDCPLLGALPRDLSVGSLSLQRRRALDALPEGLDVHFLDISGYDALTTWPVQGRGRFGHLSARDRPGLRALPDGLRVSAWVDVGGTAAVLRTGLVGAQHPQGVPRSSRSDGHSTRRERPGS